MAASAVPSTMKALTVCQWPKTGRILNVLRNFSLAAISNNLVTLQDVPTPTPAPDQLLVRVHAVALNPTDWKHCDFISPAGARIGCDFAGVVAKIPEKNTRGWKVGERVSGVVHGGLYADQGSFAEYLTVDEKVVWRVPDNMSAEEAAALGVAAVTAMQALQITLGLPWLDEKPREDGPPLLIYSGASTVGLATLQMAKLIGCTPIATCSPRSNEIVKQYGAVATFDYRSPTAIEDIRKAYPNIKMALNCFGEGTSNQFCADVMKGNDGHVVTLLPTRAKIQGAKLTSILAYTLMGKPFQWWAPIGPSFPAYPDHRAAAERYVEVVTKYIENGSIKSLPLEKVDGGLQGLLPGMDKLRKGEVSGKKLVVSFV